MFHHLPGSSRQSTDRNQAQSRSHRLQQHDDFICRTEPLLMMVIQITHKRLAYLQPVCRSWCYKTVKTKHIKVLSRTTNTENLQFATVTLKLSFAKFSISISHRCNHPSGALVLLLLLLLLYHYLYYYATNNIIIIKPLIQIIRSRTSKI